MIDARHGVKGFATIYGILWFTGRVFLRFMFAVEAFLPETCVRDFWRRTLEGVGRYIWYRIFTRRILPPLCISHPIDFLLLFFSSPVSLSAVQAVLPEPCVRDYRRKTWRGRHSYDGLHHERGG